MVAIGVSGPVRLNSGIGVIQRHIHPRLAQDTVLVSSPSRDVSGRFSELRGIAVGLAPPNPRLDGYFGTVSPLPLLAPLPLVFVVHDLRWLREGNSAKRLYRRADLAHAVRRASTLLCVSDQTRRELLEHFPEAETKARAVWLGPGVVGSSQSGSAPVPGRVLLVGGAARKRNELAGLVLEHLPQGMVSSVTGIGISEEARAACERAVGAQNVEFIQRASDDQMVKAYQEAAFYVHLGTDEGFGIPFVEALKSGAVVVAVDQPLTREVLGETAVLLPNESDPLELSAAWASAPIPDESVRSEWAGQFSWDHFEDAVREGLGLSRRNQ